jgi:lipopolysaccharide transport system permease protein
VALFPIVHLIYLVMVYGLSLALSALYVYYRDLNQIWEVVMQLGFFLSPVVYPLTTVPEKYMALYMLNPVTVVMQIYREAMLYAETPSPVSIIFVLVSALLILSLGSVVFKRLERRFAEEL